MRIVSNIKKVYAVGFVWKVCGVVCLRESRHFPVGKEIQTSCYEKRSAMAPQAWSTSQNFCNMLIILQIYSSIAADLSFWFSRKIVIMVANLSMPLVLTASN